MAEAGPKRLFIVLGAPCSGKSTLMHALTGDGLPARKTQMIDYSGEGIDTPGEYAEMGVFRKRLMSAAADARYVVAVQDATRPRSCFPPHYLLSFPRPTLGAVTKVDLPGADAVRATRLLRESGVRGEVFEVCAPQGTGVEALKSRLLSGHVTPKE